MNDAVRRGLSAPSDNKIYSDFCDDADMMELVKLYVDELPARVAAMRDAASVADWEALRRAAHQMKGAAGGYGFMSITNAAAVLESQLRAGHHGKACDESLEMLCDLCARATSQRPD